MSTFKFLTVGLTLISLCYLQGTSARAQSHTKDAPGTGPAQGQDCTQRHNWPLHVCPDGDGWTCWRDQKRRDVNCKEYDWGNRVSFPNTRGFGWCYCCGRCRVPENIFA